MTRHDLEGVIDKLVAALKTNKEVATPAVLDGLGHVLRLARESGLHRAVAGLFGPEAGTFVDSLDRLLEVERGLVGRQGDKLVEILSRVRERPVILAAIAFLV